LKFIDNILHYLSIIFNSYRRQPIRKLILFIFLVLFTSACTPKQSPQDIADTAGEPTAEYAAQTSFEPGKGVLIEQAARVTAAVLSVDRNDRSITIKDLDGTIHEVELTDDVKNFDQISPGDQVVLDIYSALFMQLAKPGEEFKDQALSQIAVAQPGDKPKLVNVDMVEVLAEITAIDREKREITVTGPRGNSITLQVPKNIEQFDDRKVGEKVNAMYVEAFAIGVEEVK
jgi:hypothetical protein